MFRLAVSLLILAPSLSAQFQAEFCRPFIRGDSNADGRVDISDCIRTLDALFSGAPLLCDRAADVHGDDTLNIADPVFTLSYLFASGQAPHVPGPFECGREEQYAGELDCIEFPPCDPPKLVTDFSAFVDFQYAQGPALGFCPLVDTVYCAQIRGEADGR